MNRLKVTCKKVQFIHVVVVFPCIAKNCIVIVKEAISFTKLFTVKILLK